ncbi:hypothetical protein BJY01DRAFT_235855 [Aspergillus pseudoustus]|uniref:FAD/NAD(P)-binding domain-containing protein n=1 Tax=Aspergillus pseudoustus TaxID=1810923 RepID=A0ABR4JSA9_9EURO
MALDTVKLVSRGITWFIPHLLRTSLQSLYAFHHSLTYRATPDPKHIVVIGGSFAGYQLVKRLTQTVPSGYTVVWIEKNSHLNYVFAFPRFSVVSGFESSAFIPYAAVESGAPRGALRRVQGAVGRVEKDKGNVVLEGGDEIPFEYLVLATGSTQPLPVQVSATERADACKELQGVQELIKGSQRIGVLGGGAVGVELASDIKDFYPDKDVTLVHSRGALLHRFGPRLQEHTLTALRDELGVRVLLGERPVLPAQGGTSMARDAKLVFKDGREEEFDLVIGCTGQRPNSSILATAYPDSICKTTSRILVKPTLQIISPTTTSSTKTDPALRPSDRIFALGDVAAHPGPLMARAGFMQAETVVHNIVNLINGRSANKIYKPYWFVEGAIKLTLGKTHNAVYGWDGGEGESGDEVMIVSRKGKVDLDVGMAWKQFGVAKEFARVQAGKLD